jgi:hypothetical protein
MPLVLNGTTGVQDNSGAFVLGTAVTTSGTSVDFTSIPSWVKRVTVMFSAVSTNGSSVPYLIQIGPSGGVETSGYLGSSSGISSSAANGVNVTAGFGLYPDNSSTVVLSGSVTISLLNAATNTWVAAGVASQSDRAYSTFSSGSKSLAGTLNRLRITTSNGTDTFDNGTINISYE